MELKSPTGETVKDIAELERTTTPSKLVQEDGDYATTVSGKITDSDVGGVSSKAIRKQHR